jgi:hypothetical protein
MRKLAILVLAASLAGCAAPLYDWGRYEESLWNLHRPGFSLEKETELLTREIDATVARGRRIPPGKLATLGFYHSQAGNLDAARSCFLREKELYPESACFVDGMMRRMP